MGLAPAIAEPVTVELKDTFLVLTGGRTEILRYHTAELEPPDGMKKIYRKSGFIHPLRTPKGGVLTGVHPEDHPHHTGLWHGWVKTRHGLENPDFWNLPKKSGRVRFAGVKELLEEGKTAGFRVYQEQVAFKGTPKREKVVLKELLEVRAKRKGSVNVVDYSVTQRNVSGVALALPIHRYGGALAYRGPLTWNLENSDYLTSKGKTRVDSHETRARWCAVFGPTETGLGTLVMMGSPTNLDAPQRLRTWPEKEGKMFFNFAATQEKAAELRAGEEWHFSYRLITADGKMESEEIEKYWKEWVAEE